MKETFTEKEFTELLELENFALGVTRSPKWTLYTRYTIVYKNYSFDDNYEIEDSDGNYMPKCNWVGFFASEDDAHYWANAAKEKGAQFTNVFRGKNEEFFSGALLNTTIDRSKEVLNINTVGQLKEELDKYNDDDYIVFIDDNKTYNFKSICGKRNKIVIPGTTKEINIRTCEVKLC